MAACAGLADTEPVPVPPLGKDEPHQRAEAGSPPSLDYKRGPTPGAGGSKKSHFLPIEESVTFARGLQLKKKKEWEAWCRLGKRPSDIPSNPHTAYKCTGWQGWGHWLGTSNMLPQQHSFLSFGRALTYARSLNLKTCKEWEEWRKSGERPSSIPSAPHKIYKDRGWQGYAHWLGNSDDSDTAAQQPRFLPFRQALSLARSLKLSMDEWAPWCSSSLRPACIPTNPHEVYQQTGWKGYAHWLGHETAGRRTCASPARNIIRHRAEVDGAVHTPARSGTRRATRREREREGESVCVAKRRRLPSPGAESNNSKG